VQVDGASDELVRHRRRTALIGAVLVVPFAAVDYLQATSNENLVAALLARAVWVASLLIGAALLSRRPPLVREASTLMAAATAAASITLVGVTGGTESGYFGFLLTLALCMVVLLPGQIVAATASGGAGIVAGALFLVDSGAAPLEIVRWVGTGAGVSALAVYGTHVGGVLIRRELAAARSRAESAASISARSTGSVDWISVRTKERFAFT